ncbi:MAG: phage terminase large subunit [Alphaproteobacteria bacterium]|nr:phage terminase large subunit [Alphaproteobacteria bacterium]MCW5741607.1 phage terminase large subunit [Alphaproteobacteria bacterium]
MHVGFEVHESHLPLWERSDWRYAFLMGGRGNGRSGTASRYCVSRLFGREYTRGALMRAVHSDIKTSSWAEVNDRLEEQNVTEAEGLRIRDMEVEYGSNSLRTHGFKASAGSLTARLKSLANYNLVWAEEAEEIGEQEFMTLDDTLRTTKGSIRIVLTLNTPAKTHWIIKRFFDLDEPPNVPGFFVPRLKPEYADQALYIPGTFRDNLPNIDPATAERYERYRQTKPAYYWQMIEGLSPEVVLGRIYSGWREIDEVPHEARLIGRGLDFGFDPDPAAVLAMYWYNGGIILDEELYQTQLLNEHLANSVKTKPTPNAPIAADSAEPKSIAEMQTYGLNVIPCEKGADSVDHGIKHVQSFKISYTKRSKNLKAEYENYAWLIDKKTGENRGIEDPKCPNHLMSAARYGLTTLVPAGSVYDPQRKDRERIEVSVTRRRLAKNQSR